MDDFGANIRSSSLEKLAVLAAKAPESGEKCDFTRLTEQCQHSQRDSNSSFKKILPIGIRELHVLVALCKAASSVTEYKHAAKLSSQLSLYLPESYGQLFHPSPFLHNVWPSPWEALTYQLTGALLSMGSDYPEVRGTVLQSVNEYLNKCAEAINAVTPFRGYEAETDEPCALHKSTSTLSLTVSLVGFLEASAAFTLFWDAREKLQIMETLRAMLSEYFMITIETASSTIRDAGTPDSKDWRRYAQRYENCGRPLGAMLLQEAFMRFVKSCATSLIGAQDMSDDELLDGYMNGVGIARSHDNVELSLNDYIMQTIADQIQLLEAGSDYLRIGTPWQQRLTYSAKALALTGYLYCLILNPNEDSSEGFLSWLESTLADSAQMSSVDLSTATLKSIAIISRMASSTASSGNRSLVRFIIEGAGATEYTGAVAAKCLAHVLSTLSEDAVITTLYFLGNVLSPGSGPDKSYQSQSYAPHPIADSAVSIAINGDKGNISYRNIIHSIVTVAVSCNEKKVSALAQSMLLQKVGKVNIAVDTFIIKETAALSISAGQAEFQLLLKFYDRIYWESVAQKCHNVIVAVQEAMSYLSSTLKRDMPFYTTYLVHLLEGIVNKGGVTDSDSERQRDIIFAQKDISPLLKPLALLISSKGTGEEEQDPSLAYSQDVSTLFRDAWFNITVHGMFLNSTVARAHFKELSLIAKNSPTLVLGGHMEVLESDVELNTILRRGMSPQRLQDQKKNLFAELPNRDAEIKRLNYPQVVFLNAALLVETLRASSGKCTGILKYFQGPALATTEMATCMFAITDMVISRYLSLTFTGKYEFSVAFLSKELAGFFMACCHRVERVQRAAILCANIIIKECPSSLCEKHSLFVLLELLTVMWNSCIEEELNEFDWKPTFESTTGIVRVDLSDNYHFRKKTLDVLLERARAWIMAVMDVAPLDVKGILQTYLSASDGNDEFGRISLGRSFALEMGSLIPRSDQRLASVETQGSSSINIASDFIAQYTTRQKYRNPSTASGAKNRPGPETLGLGISSALGSLSESNEHVENTLSHLYEQSKLRNGCSLSEVRYVLRQAAALLCNDTDRHSSIAHYLVALPFQIFSKDSINVGVSLWLGAMHENPRIKPKILVEVMNAWDKTIQRKIGVFDPSFNVVDPLYAKIELLPTDKTLMLQKQKRAQDVLAPHLHVLQFLESHFNAIRLGNVHAQRLFCRFIDRTTVGLLQISGHPLARELHFRIILFGLRILVHLNSLCIGNPWKLKDQLFSAALSWFRHPPRWSFGSNRLQIKAEDKILEDVIHALGSVAGITCQNRGQHKPLQAKQDLLQILLENERSRLSVWLSPLEPDRKHYIPQSSGNRNIAELTFLLRVAWVESPGLAIQLAARFPSTKLKSDIRGLLLTFPEKVIEEPSSLEIILGASLPIDVSSQLKYLLYWAPVDPTEALTYFLPAYGNHPFILQYAMKAMESHIIDIRFYFIPQLVQALRYDEFGYVERYILETAKQSQLFAHQVIWNMKANSYKDEDAQVPDPLKPTLDRFTEALICSFSVEERDFYEREFSFVNDITGVSGSLLPYIKKTKPEKKEKIEEELRKIKVNAGVYLPINPDGVVVGIDRKSGKPLQSHAKAPYMATFRTQKTRTRLDAHGSAGTAGALAADDASELKPKQETYEVWQSAIFKVGDDSRNDMLALQMIAAFRSIFAGVGLDVWVFPYRVTSTAPGCALIQVLPNSISRDMLGREAVNGLYDYFVSKYGREDSILFQEARTNFVKSMAAYSVISYLLQFKDRHNGNIMVDDAGHVIHIDFGFCFDIAPGGVRFERAPFKLTSEMVAVMSGRHTHTHLAGGSGSGIGLSRSSNHPTNTQPYRWFESLVVKAFLASRPYSSKLSNIVSLMLDSGLPCFKPDTLKHFRERFVLEKSEREAAEYMRELVRKSYLSMSTKGYDQFQLMTNGIPY